MTTANIWNDIIFCQKKFEIISLSLCMFYKVASIQERTKIISSIYQIAEPQPLFAQHSNVYLLHQWVEWRSFCITPIPSGMTFFNLFQPVAVAYHKGASLSYVVGSSSWSTPSTLALILLSALSWKFMLHSCYYNGYRGRRVSVWKCIHQD